MAGELVIAIYPVVPDDRPNAGTTRIAGYDLDSHEALPGRRARRNRKAEAVLRMKMVRVGAKQLRDEVESWPGPSPMRTVSTGGIGVHVRIVFRQPIEAGLVRAWLAGIAEQAGFREGEGRGCEERN